VTLKEAHEEALRILQRLETRRDPLRLREHLFLLMWYYWLCGDFEQCVKTCNDGIALSAQLGSPPVQYPSLKGLALTDLGRFDEAWASFQNEVADEQHPLGRCMRELGVAVWFESLGALDRAEAKAKEVLEEARRLSRTWMQRFVVDLLAVIAARRGREGAELAAWVENKGNQIGFHPSTLPQAEAAFARGDFETALAIADQVAYGSAPEGLRRARIVALEIGLRALARMERWDNLLERADGALREAEEASFRTRMWRMLV